MMDGHSMMTANQEEAKTERQDVYGGHSNGHHQKENYLRHDNSNIDSFKDSYAMDMDQQHDQYEHSSNYIQQEAATNINYNYVEKPHELHRPAHLEQTTNFLSGPMVVRVMPDGSPIDVQINMPKDDDDMAIGRDKMPTMHDLVHGITTMDEAPKIIMEKPPRFPHHSQKHVSVSGIFKNLFRNSH